MSNQKGRVMVHFRANPNKGKKVAPSDLDDKKEFLLYIMTQLIKLRLFGEFTNFDDPKELWNFFETNFEISNNNRKLHL